jgi:hypothetical protein
MRNSLPRLQIASRWMLKPPTKEIGIEDRADLTGSPSLRFCGQPDFACVRLQSRLRYRAI